MMTACVRKWLHRNGGGECRALLRERPSECWSVHLLGGVAGAGQAAAARRRSSVFGGASTCCPASDAAQAHSWYYQHGCPVVGACAAATQGTADFSHPHDRWQVLEAQYHCGDLLLWLQLQAKQK